MDTLNFYADTRGPEAEQKLRSGHKDQTDGNWSSFQLANITPPQSVIDRAIAPSARIPLSDTPEGRRIPLLGAQHVYT